MGWERKIISLTLKYANFQEKKVTLDAHKVKGVDGAEQNLQQKGEFLREQYTEQACQQEYPFPNQI